MSSYPVYKEKEIAAKAPIIAAAKELWAKRCAEYLATRGDQGSCVLSAGIAVEAVPSRCRVSRPMMLIRAGAVTSAQGSMVWESSSAEVLAFLKENGIEAYYDCGRMD